MENLSTDLKVLVVDDNMKNIQVIGNILVEENLDFAYALSGQTALDYLENGDFDLLLLDVMMPEMDGHQVCNIIRSQSRYDSMPIIFVTAKTEMEDIIQGFELGAQDYIIKPFNRTELTARVKTHLKLKEQQDQLQMMNEILEEKVAHRTVELKKAYDELAMLDTSKRNFITLISHELKTPLHPIQLMTSLLKEQIRTQEGLELLDLMQASIDRLNRFANASLRITQLQTRQIEPEFSDFSLYSCCERLKVYMGDDLNEKKLDLAIVMDSDLVLNGDEELISYTLEGLLKNAVQYSPEDGIIHLKALTVGDNINIRISDSGPGFSEDMIRNFPGFFMTGEKLLREDEHMGLHLATSRLIVEMHRGKIHIYNSKEGGANVELILPKLL